MAARTLDEMAAKGKDKLTRKADQMERSYYAAKDRMVSNYERLPFGPTRKANYRSGIDAAVSARRYRTDPDKWETNWKAKMSE